MVVLARPPPSTCRIRPCRLVTGTTIPTPAPRSPRTPSSSAPTSPIRSGSRNRSPIGPRRSASTPVNSGLYFERARARTSLDRYEEAVVDYDRAIQCDPQNSAAYLGRCRAKSGFGNHEQAIEDRDHAMYARLAKSAEPLDLLIAEDRRYRT